MELNKKTIKTVVNALQIARKVTEISILVDKKLTMVDSRSGEEIIHLAIDDQLRATEQIKEYDELICQFKELSGRQDYQIGEE